MGCKAERILTYMNHQNWSSILSIKVGVPFYQASYEIRDHTAAELEQVSK